MSDLHHCLACGSDLHTTRTSTGLRYECSRCSTVAADVPSPQRVEPFSYADEETVRPPRSKGSETAAAFLAGAIVMGLGGLILGGLLSGGRSEGLGIGMVAGVIAGLLVGRRIASLESIVGGAVFGGLFPFALCLLHMVRRRGQIRLQEFSDPRFPIIVLCVFGAGALVGGLLVATKKLILLGLSR